MKRLLLILIICSLSNIKLFSQTVLAPGDLLFTAIQWSGSGDGFEVITFRDLCPNTVIYFSDNPYRNTGGFCNVGGEFTIRVTIGTTVTAGSKIRFDDSGAPGTITCTSGTATADFPFVAVGGNNTGFNNNTDNCFAFQGTYLNPTFICGIKTNATWTASGGVTCSNVSHSELPSGLTSGVNAIFVSSGSDGVRYNCAVVNNTIANVKAGIMNTGNWAASTTHATTCTFTLTNAVSETCVGSCTCNIWSEDFNTTRYPSRVTTGANSNTLNPAADWTTSATDCDDATPFVTFGSGYWGTYQGEFLENDIEGGPCSCSGGGTTNNEWLSEVIDISAYTNVSICVTYRHVGTMEPNTSTNLCNDADDIIQGQYRLNGGAWQQWFFDDDEVNFSPSYVNGINASSIQLRIYLGSKANAEYHYFDNVCVTGTVIPLPVEWLGFNVVAEEKEVKLDWSTATELNADYFEIERSINGVNFETIAILNASGNSNSPSYYEWTDMSPFEGTNYYRIKEVDYNGEFIFTNIRSAYFRSNELEAKVFYSENGTEIMTSCEEDLSIEIYSLTGQHMLSLKNTSQSLILNSSNLTPGIYIANINCNSKEENLKIVIR